MKNKLEYRIENGSLIIDYYFNNLKTDSINGGRVENILNKCKLYDEEYETLLKENEYMKHIAKGFEQLQQENKQLKDLIDTILNFSLFKEECPLNFGFENNTNEDKSQSIFYEDQWCENNCNDNYKDCWLKYFKKLQELEQGSDSNE